MSDARAPRCLARALAATTIACALGGCSGLLIERAGDGGLDDAKPVIDVAQRGDAKGSMCGAAIEVVRGRVPDDARALFELDMTSARPAALRTFEDTARSRAQAACANGVSLLRATDDEGRGYVAVTVALWERTHPLDESP